MARRAGRSRHPARHTLGAGSRRTPPGVSPLPDRVPRQNHARTLRQVRLSMHQASLTGTGSLMGLTNDSEGGQGWDRRGSKTDGCGPPAGACGRQAGGGGSAMPSSARWLALLTGLLALGVGSAHAQCVSRFVDATTGSDASTDCALGSPCLTIQHAVNVDAAAGCSGDTVNVAAGTYTEQITIPTTLNLVGAGAATTIIQAPATLAGSHDIVTIGAGATVELSDFTVSGPVPLATPTCDTLGAGISVLDGATANIHDNTIADVRHEPLDFCGEGNGIVAGSGPTGTATVTIVDNTIVGYQKNGITGRGSASTATITGNTVTGAGPQTMLAQNGIQVSGGAFGDVTGNKVSGNQCDVASCGPDPLTQTQSAGIAFF